MGTASNLFNYVRDILKETLGEYVSILNKTFGKIGLTLHSIVWRYLRIAHEYPEFSDIFKDAVLDSAEKITESEFETRKSLINALENHFKINLSGYKYPSEHPWYDIAHPSLTADDIKQLGNLTPQILKKLEELKTILLNFKKFELELQTMSLSQIREFQKYLLQARSRLDSNIAEELIPALSVPNNHRIVQQILIDQDKLSKLSKQLESFFKEFGANYDLSPKKIRTIADQASKAGLENTTIADLSEKIGKVNHDLEFWKNLFSFLNPIRINMGINDQLSFRTAYLILQALSVAKEIQQQQLKYRTSEILAPENFPILKSARSLAADLKTRKEMLKTRFNLNCSIPTDEVGKAARCLEKSRFWSFLSSEFRAAKRLFYTLSVVMQEQNKIKDNGRYLADLYDFKTAEEQFLTDTKLQNILKDSFAGLETPFEPIILVNRWGFKVNELFLPLNKIKAEKTQSDTYIYEFDLSKGNQILLKLRTILFDMPAENFNELKMISEHPLFDQFVSTLASFQNFPAKGIEKEIELLEESQKILHPLDNAITELRLNPS